MAKKEIILNDSGVIYDPLPHTYRSADGKAMKGITGTLINRAYPKKNTYGGISEEVLNHAADRGSACHQAVGNYYEIGVASTGYENIVSEAKRLMESQKLTPVKFEYVVRSEDWQYASPIDIVCTDEKGQLVILDMKFTSKLHYEQVTLQTSIYKKFFHVVNPKLEAKRLFVLWIHTNDSLLPLESDILELTPTSDEFINDLIAADEADTVFDVTKYYGELPARISEIEDYVAQLTNEVKEKTEKLSQIKDGLCQLMIQNNIKQYSSRRLTLTTVTPKPRVSFDTTRFKKEHKNLYDEYTKMSEVKPSVRLTVK